MKKKRKPLLEFVYKTPIDLQKEWEQIVSNIKENTMSDFTFNGETLYCVGNGHQMLSGFYWTFATKSGIKATKYYEYWDIGDSSYEWVDSEFIKIEEIEKVEKVPLDLSNLSLPSMKVAAKTIADDIIPINPKEK